MTATGTSRNLIDEKTDTFIWTAHAEAVFANAAQSSQVNWLSQSDEIIYVSERDGWRHLYLVDAKEGTIKNPITKGEWVVRGIGPHRRTRPPGLVPGQWQERRPGTRTSFITTASTSTAPASSP